MTDNELLHRLYQGDFDDIIDEVVAASRRRLHKYTQSLLQQIRKGDEVIFNATVNPKDLVGAHATVVRVKNEIVRVELEDTCGNNWPIGAEVEVPASVLRVY